MTWFAVGLFGVIWLSTCVGLVYVGRSFFLKRKGQPTKDQVSGSVDPRFLQVQEAARFVLGAWDLYRRGDISRENFRKRLARFEGVLIIAIRSSVMDDHTCDACVALDGAATLLHSAAYREMAPPAHCAKGDECHCLLQYIAADSEEDLVPRILRQALSSGVATPSDYLAPSGAT